jgi:hypothetical protein
MKRPPLEVADIVRCAGQSFLERSQRWINWQHQKVLLAITRCRTAALGGHRDRCSGCGHGEFFRAFGGWPGSRTTTFRIKLRACQRDDKMTVSRHRHVVTQPLCDIRKSYLFFS